MPSWVGVAYAVCAGSALDVDKELLVSNSESKVIITAWLTSLFFTVVELVHDLSAEPWRFF